MNSTRKILLGALALAGLQFALLSCVGPGYVETGVYYGGGPRPWFNDGPWFDGHRGYYDHGGGGGRADVYISPPRLPSPPGIHIR